MIKIQILDDIKKVKNKVSKSLYEELDYQFTEMATALDEDPESFNLSEVGFYYIFEKSDLKDINKAIKKIGFKNKDVLKDYSDKFVEKDFISLIFGSGDYADVIYIMKEDLNDEIKKLINERKIKKYKSIYN